MGAHTTLSGKGQVVIPRDVRDRLKLSPGDKLDGIERPDGVLLRRQPVREIGRLAEHIVAELRALYTHKRPPVSVEEMDAAIGAMFSSRARSDI